MHKLTRQAINSQNQTPRKITLSQSNVLNDKSVKERFEKLERLKSKQQEILKRTITPKIEQTTTPKIEQTTTPKIEQTTTPKIIITSPTIKPKKPIPNNIQQKLSRKPIIGARPQITQVVGQRPTVTQVVGQRPTVTQVVGQRPTVTQVVGKAFGDMAPKAKQRPTVDKNQKVEGS
jgi:hypothetical protein